LKKGVTGVVYATGGLRSTAHGALRGCRGMLKRLHGYTN